MSKLSEPEAVFFFASWIINTNFFSKAQIQQQLAQHFGEKCTSLDPRANPSIDYYAQEMGERSGLLRMISFCPKIANREDLLEHKLWAHEWEQDSCRDGKRTLNLDIGFLALEQVVLATGKKYAHRLYLGRGIYAELVFTYQNKQFHSLPWTYPDYLEQRKIDFFEQMRKQLLKARLV